MNKIHSIRTKLIVYFLLIAIIPVSAAGYFAFENGRAALEEKTFDHLTTAAILKEAAISEWINDKVIAIGVIKKLVEYDIVTTLKHSEAELEVNEESHMAVIDVFNKVLMEEPSFFEFFVIDSDTEFVHLSTDDKQIGKIKSNRPYFEEGKEGTFVQNIYYSVTTNEPAMTISIPVKNESDTVVAVFAGRINLSIIGGIMTERSGLGETGETYLVNKFNFLMSPLRFGEESEFYMGIYSEGVLDCLQHNNGVGLYDDYRGIPVIGSYRWMSERELCIMAEIDQSEAFASIIGLRNMIISTIFGIGIIVTFLGIFVSSSFSNPIKKLTDKIRVVSKGDFDIEGDINFRESKDEIGELTRSFKKMAHDLHKITVSRDELDKEIIERQKAEEKITKQNIQLKKLDKLKSDFLNVTSHELRTPMTAMKGYLQMLMGKKFGKLTDEQVKTLDVILRNTNRLDNLVADILDTSRLESGTMKFMPELVDTKKLMDEVVETMQTTVKEKKIKIISDSEFELPDLTIDKDRIKQVFNNLITNAMKFSSDNSEIHLRANIWNDDVLFEVQDFGKGIPKGELEKIFEVFYQ
ncbi:MAG: histidine kinase dimerization/phospho-acceptor domain-containing protein, partial [Candidatus Hodarchaeales archaeon]